MRNVPYRTATASDVADSQAEPVDGLVAALALLAAGIVAIASGVPLGIVLVIVGVTFVGDEVRCRMRSRA